jgi:hypothetical protein
VSAVVSTDIIPSSPDQVTPTWLSTVLGDADVRVSGVAMTPVGTGQTGAAYRASVEYAANPSSLPTSFVVKLPSQDQEIRSRVGLGCKTEAGFYRELASRVQVPIPKAYHCDSANDGHDFVLVMQDLTPAVQGDEVAGCSVHAATLAAKAIAGLHAPFWCDEKIADFPHVVIPKTTPELADGVGIAVRMAADVTLRDFGSHLSDEDCRTIDEAANMTPAWLTSTPERFSILHGDYRLNNVLFAPDESWISVVDWQSTMIGLPTRDLAYFVVSGLQPERRCESERELVNVYTRALRGHGVTNYDEDTCWQDYRLGVLQLNLIATLGFASTATPTHRSEAMMETLFSRSCRAIRELEVFELIHELNA